uniref:Uncharacterized protein n=1 Tax=Clostridium botulinum TaxID=1491 RepID=A0A126JHV8_CLOBO|nr:hypothetical protein [Clostridium botulinum]
MGCSCTLCRMEEEFINIICKHCGSDEGFYIKTQYYAMYSREKCLL